MKVPTHHKVPVIGLAAVVGAALCVTVLCRKRSDGTAEVGHKPCCSNCAHPHLHLPCASTLAAKRGHR